MKINVLHKDYGFFSEIPITVQKIDWHKDEGEGYKDVYWCNHDGFTIEQDTIHHAFNDGTSSEYSINFYKCDKCDAYRFEDEDYWQEAPFEGVS